MPSPKCLCHYSCILFFKEFLVVFMGLFHLVFLGTLGGGFSERIVTYSRLSQGVAKQEFEIGSSCLNVSILSTLLH